MRATLGRFYIIVEAQMRQAVLFQLKTPHGEASEHFRGPLCGVSCFFFFFFTHSVMFFDMLLCSTGLNISLLSR